jgi:ADP-ribose pyrophosphatase YjhB (NUDIX family)
MTEPDGNLWLDRIRRLRAIAQTGLAYSRDGYDLERFREVESIAERMLADLVDVPPARLRDLYLPERGYPTPKVDVRAGVLRDGRVLLVRETSDGRWALPGGWADEAASPRQNVEREVLEESGYRVRAVKLVAVKDRRLHPYRPQRLETVYKLLFLCDLAPGGSFAGNPGLETTAARFFPLDRLPELSAGRTVAADIEALAAHQRDPSLPVYVD